MNTLVRKGRDWIWPVAGLLFLLTMLSFIMVVKAVYSWDSRSVEHTLTYSPGELTWGSGTRVLSDGSADLALFSPQEDPVVMPGSHSSSTIRLISQASGPVTYTAVAYQISPGMEEYARLEMTAEDAAETSSYPLPDGVEKSQVVSAVTGTLDARAYTSMTLDWNWDYDAGNDGEDTALAGQGKDVHVGIFLTVQDGNTVYTADGPKTGDTSRMFLWAGVLLLSLFFLVMTLCRLRKGEDRR